MRRFWNNGVIKRHLQHRICVIGSGPSGFYSTKYLLDQKSSSYGDIHIDMIDKLPTPFGLVRYGVAPDHPEVKSVIDQFIEVANNQKFRYYGNIEVGKDITIQQLQERYSAILLAYGAEGNRNLNIPGEDMNGVYSAREFVNWYNGHPDSSDFGKKINFQKIQNVVIIGQGNVALDCARILAKEEVELSSTDITTSSLEQLRGHNIKKISLIGRRGYGQIACTIKELRELTKLQNVDVIIEQEEMKKGENDSTRQEIQEKRPLKRLTDLLNEIMEGTMKRNEKTESDVKVENTVLENKKSEKTNTQIEFKFLLKPNEIRGDGNCVQEIIFDKCVLTGAPHEQNAKPTGETVTLPCDLILTSIGYKTLPISPDLPFNYNTHTIPHLQGRVVMTNESDKSVLKGLYVTGWCKRGPTGIIGTNINDAKESIGSILQDIQNGILVGIDENKIHDLHHWLMNCKRKFNENENDLRNKVVTWEDVLRLDNYERAAGKSRVPEKPREKCQTIHEMLIKIQELATSSPSPSPSS